MKRLQDTVTNALEGHRIKGFVAEGSRLGIPLADAQHKGVWVARAPMTRIAYKAK